MGVPKFTAWLRQQQKNFNKFFIVKKPNFDSESLKELSKTLSKFSDTKDILLEIDLHKIDKKFNFYID